MIKTVSLESFKGTTRVVNLDQLNIFRGASGSGKSTWLEAVRVAIMGHDPGYGKLLSETMSFASSNGMTVQITHDDVTVMRVFTMMAGKAKQTIAINGKAMIAKLADPELIKHFGQFPMMLNPDEFFSMSDDKKISFLFGLSDTETDSELLRRKCILEAMAQYTDAADLILQYEFKGADPLTAKFDEGLFVRLVNLTIEKIAEKDAPAGRALTKVFCELLPQNSTLSNGQETLSMYAEAVRAEINATRRAKQDAEAANRKLVEEKAEKMKLVAYNEEENNAEIEKLRSSISEIEKELHSREKLKSAKSRLASGIEVHVAAIGKNKQDVEDLKATLLSEEQVKETNALMAGIERTSSVLSEKHETARVRHERLIGKVGTQDLSRPTPSCSVCGTTVKCEKCKPMSAAQKKKAKKEAKDLSEKLKEVEVYMASISCVQQKNALDMKNVAEIMNTHEDNLSKYHVATLHLKELGDLIEEEKKNLDNIEEPGAGTDVLQLSLKVQKVSLAERLIAEKNHQWLRTLAGTIASSNETIFNSDALVSALLATERSVKSVRNTLTSLATEKVETVCNDLLKRVRKDFFLTYDIEDGKFDIRCMNVNGNTVAFKTLSGGEKVLYLSAQLLALMTIVNPKLKILEVEMGELSGDLVPPFMAALKEMTEGSDIQVVLSSCHTDFDVEDEAWKIHWMGKGAEDGNDQ